VISVQADSQGLYQLGYVGFGSAAFNLALEPYAPTAGYYQKLGYPGQPQGAILALDFVGLGLPYYLWYQVTNLLYKVDQNIADDLSCFPENGGICKLKASCESYPNLWNEGWTFNIRF
jgi:hypothetical protein